MNCYSAFDALPTLDTRSADEILDYNDYGLASQAS
jgi:hypothetical protein